MEGKELRWTKMAAICAAALLLFWGASRGVNRRTEELRAQEETLTSQLSSLKREQENLTQETMQVGTESYIESRARSDYQYVKPGELRFEIINPGALYDSTDAELAQAESTVQPAEP